MENTYRTYLPPPAFPHDIQRHFSIQEVVIYCQHLQYHQSPYLQEVVCADMRVDRSWDKGAAAGGEQHIYLAIVRDKSQFWN